MARRHQIENYSRARFWGMLSGSVVGASCRGKLSGHIVYKVLDTENLERTTAIDSVEQRDSWIYIPMYATTP